MNTVPSVRKHASVMSLSLLLLTLSNVYAQDKTTEVDKLFTWASQETPGCVCAVSQNGKVIMNRAYGSADLERDVPLSTNTVFDAGSLTKQFVAATVLMLVEEKRISLSDDVRKYIPELPDHGHKIMIDHLLTHTSGLRDWTGIQPMTSGTTDALAITLRQKGLNFAPGEEWSYSNSGYVLLKEIVARISGMPFGEVARKRLFEPLGMRSTSYNNDLREIVKNRALAYEKDNGRWKMAMLLDNDRGGGGALLSTASDLLIWNDALTNEKLGAFVTNKLQEPAKLNSGRKINYARGLFLDSNRGGKIVWHSGGASGYRSLLSRYPEQNLSIAILCNAGETGDRMAIARRLFDLFVPATENRSGASNAQTQGNDMKPVEGLDVNSKAGLFFNEVNGEWLRLAVDNGRLRIAGGPGLIPVTKDHFKRLGANLQFMSQDEFEIQFLSPDQFELKSMEGKIKRYRRAQPFKPTAEDLKAFTGRYHSEEIGAVFQFANKEGSLMISIEHSPEKNFELSPVDRDVFQRGNITVRFIRDKSGKITAFDYSNPLIRNIRFRRLN